MLLFPGDTYLGPVMGSIVYPSNRSPFRITFIVNIIYWIILESRNLIVGKNREEVVLYVLKTFFIIKPISGAIMDIKDIFIIDFDLVHFLLYKLVLQQILVVKTL